MSFVYSTLKGIIIILITLSICRIIDTIYAHVQNKHMDKQKSECDLDFYDFINISQLYLNHIGYKKISTVNNDCLFLSPSDDINHITFIDTSKSKLNEIHIYSTLGLMIKEGIYTSIIFIDSPLDPNIKSFCDSINEKGAYKISILTKNNINNYLTIKTS